MSQELLKLALTNPGLARKKIAWAKKKAAMEKPFKSEYSLVKKASYLDVLSTISKQKKLEKALKTGLGIVGAGAGGLGGYGLLLSMAPGHFTEHAILRHTPLIGGGMALGALSGAQVGESIGKGINSMRNPKAYRARNTMTEALSNLTKTSSLSRAAKGAIGLPLGVMGAAAIHPELFGHVQNVGILDSVAGRVLGSLDNIASPVLGESFSQSTNALASLGALSALGAGAGKLSERVIPIAKAPIARAASPAVAAASGISAKKKAAIIAALLASGGGGYLLGKNNSDS